jgi:molybdopterin-guanine dinucleotide biosynthesis adapter protein
MRSLGIIGWSGSGKTTLIVAVLPLLRGRGLSVSTIKHVHHGFDIDQSGKDSYRHRQAGAKEVLVCSSERWVLLHENDGHEAIPAELVRVMEPVDLVLVEGFKADPGTKLEIYRPALGKEPLWPTMPDVAAVASDVFLPGCGRCLLPLDCPDAVADWITGILPKLPTA